MSNFHFKKSLGQNFLHNPKVLERIASFGKITENDVVIEIGCGNGSLTEYILNFNPKKLIVWELDERCLDLMQEKLKNHKNFTKIEAIHKDALLLDVPSLKLETLPIIISNLPYSVGSRIFINLLSQINSIKLMILMFQKEVAARIVAKNNSKDYSIFSVMSQLVSSCKIEFDVSPKNFTPIPKVMSSIISCKNINANITQESFNFILEQGKYLFSNRRKMIRSYCKHWNLNLLDLYGAMRVENLTPQQIMFCILESKSFNKIDI